MDTYSPLLERTRLPQPSLQKLAVVSIFDKLRSSPPHSGPDSDRGRSAITQCLHSNSPAVVDQSVRELCLLVKDSKLELSSGLMEFQSALEGTNSRFVNVFVKAIGFLVRLGFQNDVDSFRFGSSEAHPFVKIFSCRVEVQSELVHQVLIFIMQNKHLGLVAVCEFLKPFINYSVIRMPSSPIMSTFAIKLLSSMASLCCAFPKEALPVFKLLMECVKYFPFNNAEELTNITYIMEYTVDVFTVVLKNLVQSGSLIHETQLCGMELLGIILSLGSHLQKRYGESESIFEMSRRLLIVQGELGLSYIPTVSSVMRSLFVGLIQSELEHVQLSILKLLLFLLKWKSAYENVRPSCELHEELLFVLPLINLISSPAKSVKELATELLLILGKLIVNVTVAPKNELLVQEGFPCSSKPEDIIFRFLQRLWFQDQTSLSGSFYIHWLSDGGNNSKEKLKVAESWTTLIMDYSQGIMGKQKLSLPISRSEEIFLHEMPPLLSAIAGVLVVHHTLWNSAIDLLAVTGNMDPKLGVPLFLLILFYSNVLSGKFKEIYFHDILLKLLGMLPSLSSHPAMIPLVVQTILPMLQKDAKPELYATAMRLLCKTWEINDRIFGSLQGLLLPKGFREFTCDRNICISMAVSVRDVCRRNPDRGVDLILSVEDCIESKDPIIQALGLQSLAHLCEADVVDFYTAWGVIAKHVLNYSRNPVVADSLCLLLRWGAMDAEVYPEAAMNVLQILWEVGTSTHAGQASLWANARASSFEALTCYEVPHIQQLIPGFRAKNMEVLISETDPKVLGAMEKFEAKIITHEHITRRRLVKEKRVPTNKIEKLLDVFPRVIGISGNNSKARELPGAALFCLSFSIKEDNNQGASKVLQNLHDRYGNALLEIAGSLQLSRNILIALLALQSWKPFLRRWLRACIILLDPKASSSSLDTLSKAAEDILKCIRRKAEDSIPRSAENIALAVGAFCTVLPPSAHAVKSAASKFLLNWLFQYEHEYRQWSAAISLGVVSSCLHVTDHKQKFQSINALIEVAATSKSTLVKGACGVGLGFSCQVFLTTPELEDDSQLDKNMYRLQEIDLLGRIIWTLSQLIGHFAQSSSAVLESISKYFPHSTGNANQDIPLNMLGENGEYLEEDIWGITGLVLGLGCSVTAIYRSGCADAVLEIKNIITSWIPHVNPLAQNSGISDKGEIVLSVGSCLALPFVVALCQRVELIDGAELDLLAVSYRELIDELSSVKKSGALHQSLLMASCVGVGNLLSCILNEGLHSMDVKFVKDLLGQFKKIYSSPYPPLIHLGGMLGVVNTLGAGAGTLFLHHSLPSPHSSYDYKESSYIMGPLLSSAVMEPILTLSIQEIFLVAQNSDECQMQQYAAWAVSFLRHSLFSRQLPKEDSDFQKDTTRTKSVPQSFPEDSLVMELCSWLMNLNHSAIGATPNVNTVAASLRCLSHAPRLPQLDWGPIIRKCMRYKDQTAVILLKDCGSEKVNLREECLSFTLVHAKNFDSLLIFLDELSDLSRFKMLEINLQLYLLLHLSDLLKIFSGSRLERLFDDISSFINSLGSPEQTYNTEQKSLLRTSCWTGLYMCLETSVDSQECISNLENCMEVLFSLAPEGLYSRLALENKNYLMEEQHEAIRCLGKARRDWLSDLLLVSEVNLREQGPQFSEAKKKIQATARLVGFGSVSLIELAKLKPYILNIKSEVIWDVLVEVTAALNHAEGTVRRKWLVEAVEISCVTSYPSTALRFIGLLCGSFSKYMPLLIVDPTTVLCDLPVTLPSLLLDDSSWGLVAETVVSHLFTSTERIYNWVIRTTRADDPPSQHLPDDSEEINAIMLLNVMHHTCLNLKDHLLPEKLLRLANMVIPEYIVS